ncbi:MAG: EsaB/YukD family protein, partial [Nocardioidaceae bacterium]
MTQSLTHSAAPAAAALVRVTVVAGERRADLALPGGVPVAELLPELARTVGVLDAENVYGGYGLRAADGRLLSGETGLVFQ